MDRSVAAAQWSAVQCSAVQFPISIFRMPHSAANTKHVATWHNAKCADKMLSEALKASKLNYATSTLTVYIYICVRVCVCVCIYCICNNSCSQRKYIHQAQFNTIFSHIDPLMTKLPLICLLCSFKPTCLQQRSTNRYLHMCTCMYAWRFRNFTFKFHILWKISIEFYIDSEVSA